MKQFHTKVVGVTFENRQDYIKGMKIGEKIRLERDKNNPYDKNAIKVINAKGNQIGFISKELASKIAGKMDKGIKFRVAVSDITGSKDSVIGVNLIIRETP
ncbi:MAG: HIRAN domain-containing protein [Bacilli bacterium]|jgi:single-stranded-DNA-specific exonuclease